MAEKLLSKVIKIQEMQFELDKAKKEQQRWNKIVRSLSQQIPERLRELPLK